MRIKGILFDFDGTLGNTAPVIFASYAYSTKKVLGHEADIEPFKKTFGRPLRPSLQKIFGEETGDKITECYRAFQVEHHDELIEPFPGVKETLAELSSRGIQMAVVTSKFTDTCLRGLRCLGLDKYISCIIGAEKVKKPKPDPETCLKALHEIGLTGPETIVVGDSPYDLLSGRAASCRAAVAVGYSIFDRQELIREGRPDFIIEKMPDLINVLDGLEEKGDKP